MTHPSSAPRLIALIIACAMFMAQLDGAVVTLVLPDLARSFGTTALNASIGITAYLLVQVVLLPASSWIADRFGARRIFALAMLGFTAASVMCALSRSLPAFVAARILQGCAAALMSPVGRIVLLNSTRKEDLVRVMAINTMPMLLAPSLGPLVGGLIGTYCSWPWIFLLNVPIGILGTMLTLRFIPRSVRKPRRPFDLTGFVLFGAAFTLVIEALDMAAKDSRHWPLPAALFASGCLLGAAAFAHARRHGHPIISLSATRIPTYVIATLTGGGIVRLPLRALAFVLPLMFQLAMGFSVVQSGMLLMAMGGSDLIVKTVTTRILKRYGFRSVLLSTATLSSATLAACLLFSPSTPVIAIVTLLLVSGMLRSLLFTGMSALALADVPSQELSSSSVLWNVMLQATNSLAVSLSVIALTLSAAASGETAGQPSLHDFRATLLVMAAIGLLSVPSFRKLRQDAGSELSGHRFHAPR